MKFITNTLLATMLFFVGTASSSASGFMNMMSAAVSAVQTQKGLSGNPFAILKTKQAAAASAVQAAPTVSVAPQNGDPAMATTMEAVQVEYAAFYDDPQYTDKQKATMKQLEGMMIPGKSTPEQYMTLLQHYRELVARSMKVANTPHAGKESAEIAQIAEANAKADNRLSIDVSGVKNEMINQGAQALGGWIGSILRR
jgi:hypothetical protein